MSKYRRSCRSFADQPVHGDGADDPHVLARRHPSAGRFLRQVLRLVAAIEAQLYGLAIIGVLASVVGAYYYLRVIKVMWFESQRRVCPNGGRA